MSVCVFSCVRLELIAHLSGWWALWCEIWTGFSQCWCHHWHKRFIDIYHTSFLTLMVITFPPLQNQPALLTFSFIPEIFILYCCLYVLATNTVPYCTLLPNEPRLPLTIMSMRRTTATLWQMAVSIKCQNILIIFWINTWVTFVR